MNELLLSSRLNLDEGLLSLLLSLKEPFLSSRLNLDEGLLSENLSEPRLPRLSKDFPPLLPPPPLRSPLFLSCLKLGSISLCIAFHLLLSSPPIKLKAEPSAPALAVLPIR